ncbi:MAG: hypothetical protein MI861_16735, partial [Pirellulales bacterium]|nr:hypothetical protein [Pirellulales bacterium]
GKTFVDFDGDQQLDFDEPTIPEIEVTSVQLAQPPVKTVVKSEPDDLETVNIDESGTIEFLDLPPGQYRFDVTVPTGWSLSTQRLDRVTSKSIQPDGDSRNASISDNLQFIAFTSTARNLVSDDTNNMADVFVYNRHAREVESITRFSSGVSASTRPSISGDGRFVAFSSFASEFVVNDTNGVEDVFVYDRENDSFERVSVDAGGNQLADRSRSASMTPDGRFVAFVTDNHASGPVFRQGDIFVRDRITNTTEQISISAAGVTFVDPKISADGNVIVFRKDGNDDILVFERGMGVREIGRQGRNAEVSQDGRFVSYEAPLGSSPRMIFVYDLQQNTEQVVSINADDVIGDGNSFGASLSEDGRFIVYNSTAENLVPGDTNSFVDTFIYDRVNDRVRRVSIGRDGTQGDGDSLSVTISRDGRLIAFQSSASNIVPQDSNSSDDIFFVQNPLIEPGVTRTVVAGDVIT